MGQREHVHALRTVIQQVILLHPAVRAATTDPRIRITSTVKTNQSIRERIKSKLGQKELILS